MIEVRRKLPNDYKPKPDQYIITPKDVELSKLCCLTNKEIGMRLGVADRTVNSRFYYLFRRLNVTSRQALAIALIRDGILRPEEFSNDN